MVVGLMSSVLAFMLIHDFLLLPAFSPPTIAFQTFTNNPSGQRYAVAEITNNDICTISFHGPFMEIPNNVTNPVVAWLNIESSLTNVTLTKGRSCVATFQVPHYFIRYTNNLFVVFVVTRHTLIQRSFGWLFDFKSFDDSAEGKIGP